MFVFAALRDEHIYGIISSELQIFLKKSLWVITEDQKILGSCWMFLPGSFRTCLWHCVFPRSRIKNCLNINSYLGQLSINHSAEAVFGLIWSTQPAPVDPVLQKSFRQCQRSTVVSETLVQYTLQLVLPFLPQLPASFVLHGSTCLTFGTKSFFCILFPVLVAPPLSTSRILSCSPHCVKSL